MSDLRPIFSSPEDLSNDVDNALMNGIANQFPVENNNYRLELTNIHVAKKVFDHSDEKKAILESGSLTYPVKGDLTLIDKATGKVVDSVSNYSLADSFAITPKHTMVYKGNNYSVSNLIQLLPGAYSMRKDTGETTTHFNTGSGASFNITLDPKTETFYLAVKGSNTPIAPLLTEVFGFNEGQISKYIPMQVWRTNVANTVGKEDRFITALYSRLVNTRLQNKDDPFDVKCQKLKESLEASTLHPKTTAVTLGKSFSRVQGEALLLAMKNLVGIHTGEREEDNRDSLQFKKVQNLADNIARRFLEEKSHELVHKTTSKITFNLEKIDPERPRIADILPGKPYNKIFTNFLVASPLASTPSETNPIESLENVGKLTVIGPGEGGIGDARRVQLTARSIDPSHLGIIDPARTPESASAGIDQRFTISARRDKEGNMYAKVVDRDGKVHFLSVHDMMTNVIGLPGEKGKTGLVYAHVNGKLSQIDAKKVQYWIHDPTDTYTVTTNLVPFLNSNHSQRLTMAGKAIPQALSLQEREIPLVQTVNHQGKSFTDTLGAVISTTSPVSGIVTKVTGGEIHIKKDEGGVHKLKLVRNLPYNQKGFMDDEKVLVQEGDRVEKSQVVADNNYTRDGKLALGKNLYAAYIPWRGYNHEDGIVIRKGAADSLKSLHAYKYDYAVREETVANKSLFRRFCSKLTPEQLNKLDENGYAKPGVKLQHGDAVYAVLEKRELTAEDKIFARTGKQLVNPYRPVIEYWQHDEVGEVVDAHTSGKDIRILCRSIKPLEIGDKLTGLHGNKGVVSLILDDDKMPVSNTTGKPVDLLLNPASVTSRVNFGQLMETAAAKIAAKTGSPYLVKNYEKDSNIHAFQQELKQHGLSDTDEIVDPVTGKTLGGFLAGPQYFLKLYKTTDSNFSARNVKGYDNTMQPTKGGEEGSKAVGYMEFLGLLGSDARKNLREMGTIKSEKNEDFWHKFATGQPLPKPRTTFATRKFFDYLRALGVGVREEDGKLSLKPMTDHEILSMSNGQIKAPKFFTAKDLSPEKGGMFDVAITGGVRGEKWAHYRLAEPVVNPMFENHVKTLLGVNASQYDGLVSGSLGVVKDAEGGYSVHSTSDDKHEFSIQPNMGFTPKVEKGLKKKASTEEYKVGGHAFKELLSNIDIDKEIAAAREGAMKASSVSKRDQYVKRLKVLAGFRKQGFNNLADAVLLHNVPVLPPIMRQAMNQGANRIEYADVNHLYKDHMLVNMSLKDIIDHLPPEVLTTERKALYDGVKAIQGLGEPINRGRPLKGLMSDIAGETGPKTGFFHDKILSKKQDFSGRATIYAAPDVGFNEAKFPKEMLWKMYHYHILRDMVKFGYSLGEAREAVEKRTLPAINSFNKITKEVPLLINRAPTLMKTNIMAMMPVPVDGKTIGLNPLHLPGFAADYDGDAMSVYVPMTAEAIHEAREKLLPQNHLNDARRGHGSPMFAPGHEAILGSVFLTEPDKDQQVVKFKTKKEALEALKSGQVTENTPIEIEEH